MITIKEYTEQLETENRTLYEDKDYWKRLAEKRKYQLQQKENIINELKERSLQYSEEIDRLLDIKEKVRECLYKNRVYIAGERNLAFEIEQILDKENNNEKCKRDV